MSRQITITSSNGVTLKTKNKYLDDDINVGLSEAGNIIAGNIKSGVSILGVTGTYEGFVPSGSMSIVENGTYNVTNYAGVTVNVPSSGGDAEYVLKRISYGHKAIFIANYLSTENTYGTTIQLEAIN